MTTPLEDPNKHLRGASTVRLAIAQVLKTDYPAMRLRCINSWQMQATDLPPVERFSPFDNIATTNGDKPMIGVDAVSSGSYMKTDHDDYAGQEFRPTYSMRVTLWLHSPNDEDGSPLPQSRAQTIRQRDDQLAVLKSVLLNKPSLGTPTLTLQIDSLSENYFSPSPVANNSSRWLVAGQLSFDVKSDEWVTDTAIGFVDKNLGVETEVLLAGKRLT